MSFPDQIQTQLLGRPARFADLTGTLRNGRSIGTACRPVLATTLTHSLDVPQPSVVGDNLELTMPAGNAFFGHACVSPSGVEDHSTPEPETCASTNLGHSIQGAVA